LRRFAAGKRFGKRLTLALGPDVLTPAYSFYSMTERSEYTTTEAEHASELKSKGMNEGTPEFERRSAKWR
jgi:chlorite dismutase